MKDQVCVVAVSNDANTCKSIYRAFEGEALGAVCVPSPMHALDLLERGVVANYVLIDAPRKRMGDGFFAPALLERLDSERLCILAEPGDTSWAKEAARWNIAKVLTLPLLPRDIETFTDACTKGAIRLSASSGPIAAPHHLEELDRNRFFLAASSCMLQLYREIRTLAPVKVPVLILGESGVGKENVAMLLHKYHARAEKKLLNLNCAALPNDLLESELFGYEAGAFTGALKSKPGLFEQAHGGTILLDEIGEMSPPMQAKLLHVLQDGSFCRLGARASSHVDVRVLAATNIDMQEAITAKRFREDLYYRLNTFTLIVPPLRERREEIPLLMEQLFQRGSSELEQSFQCPEGIVEAAQVYDWPGNLRELRNFVTRLLVLKDATAAYKYLRANTTTVSVPVAAASSAPAERAVAAAVEPEAGGMKNAVNVVKNATEIRILQDALSASGWNRRRAATNLHISYRSLLYKIQQHGLSA